jgi:hypothetical protein
MYLFTRTARLTQGGRVADKIAAAVELTSLVSAASGQAIGLHATEFSPALGTIVWSIFVEDLPTLQAGGDAMLADAAVQDFIAARGGELFADGMDDSLLEILHGVPDGEREINYVAGIESAVGPGKLRQGIGLGIELAEKSSAISGQSCLFVTAMTGVFGGVGWLTGYPDLVSLQDGQHAIFSDPAMLDLIDGPAAEAFPPGGTTSTIYRRIV